MSGPAKAKVTKATANGKTYAHIKFYTSNENETYAEVCCMLFLSLSSLTVPAFPIAPVCCRRSRTYYFPLGFDKQKKTSLIDCSLGRLMRPA